MAILRGNAILLSMEGLFDIWQKQKLFLDDARKKNPALFVREVIIDDEDTLKCVGIEGLPTPRPVVYLRLWPQDFIVEEMTKDGRLHTIDYEDENIGNEVVGQTVYADLVKVGVSTLDVIDELSQKLNVARNSIGYAGIKDRDAITSQLISFRNLPIDLINSVRYKINSRAVAL